MFHIWKISLPASGIEPGPSGWEPDNLATRPWHLFYISLQIQVHNVNINSMNFKDGVQMEV